MFGGVVALGGKAGGGGHPHPRHQVYVFVLVICKLAGNPVFEETEAHSHVQSPVLFPPQVRVRGIVDDTLAVEVGLGVPVAAEIIHYQHGIYGLVHSSRISESRLEAETAQNWLQGLHPFFFVYVPGSADRPVEVELLVASEIAGTVAP